MKVSMSTYCDYYVDHDLDTTSIKALLANLEKRLGYKPKWMKDYNDFTDDGYYLFWEEPDDPYDPSKDQDFRNIALLYVEDGTGMFKMNFFYKVFSFWVLDGGDEIEFPLHFAWFSFLRHFLGCEDECIEKDEEVVNGVYKVLRWYKKVFAPFHPTTFLAEGEEDEWVANVEDNPFSLQDLMKIPWISDDGKDSLPPVAINRSSYADYLILCKDGMPVFFESFDKV